MNRVVRILAIVVVSAALLPGAALAAKGGKKGLKSSNFQAGADVGVYAFGTIQGGTAKFGEEEASFSGTGGLGPIFGAHFNMLAAEKWIIHLDVAYSYQRGTATVDFDNKDLPDPTKDFDYSMEMFRGSVGVGQQIINTAFVTPYWMLGVALHHMAFQEEDEDEAATGAGFGAWGALGVDAKIMRSKGFTIFGGGQFRLDLLYSVDPLKRKDTELTMAYIPISAILTGGIEF